MVQKKERNIRKRKALEEQEACSDGEGDDQCLRCKNKS